MKLTKIHRVLKFKESDWVKKYINFNTEQRINAANNSKKIFLSWWSTVSMAKQWKIYKKELTSDWLKVKKGFKKYISRTTHIIHKIFGKNYAAAHEIKPVLTLNKPIYVWFTVLQLSKWLMYDFHYNFSKTFFVGQLLFTDTDERCLRRLF